MRDSFPSSSPRLSGQPALLRSPAALGLLGLALLLGACGGSSLPTEPSPPSFEKAGSAASGNDAAAAPKVDICHRRGNGDFHVINVSQNAEPAHMAHGDGKPGGEVPGSGGTEVFDAVCQPVAAPPPCGGAPGGGVGGGGSDSDYDGGNIGNAGPGGEVPPPPLVPLPLDPCQP